MHLFGGKFCMHLVEKRQCTCDEILKNMCRCDRKNFDTLQWSLVTVFQILTQEDWNEVLYNGMARTSFWASLYFVALMTFGNYVLFNLLVAILVESFASEGDASLEEDIEVHISENTKKYNTNFIKPEISFQNHSDLSCNNQEEISNINDECDIQLLDIDKVIYGNCYLNTMNNVNNNIIIPPKVDACCINNILKLNTNINIKTEDANNINNNISFKLGNTEIYHNKNQNNEVKIALYCDNIKKLICSNSKKFTDCCLSNSTGFNNENDNNLQIKRLHRCKTELNMTDQNDKRKLFGKANPDNKFAISFDEQYILKENKTISLNQNESNYNHDFKKEIENLKISINNINKSDDANNFFTQKNSNKCSNINNDKHFQRRNTLPSKYINLKKSDLEINMGSNEVFLCAENEKLLQKKEKIPIKKLSIDTQQFNLLKNIKPHAINHPVIKKSNLRRMTIDCGNNTNSDGRLRLQQHHSFNVVKNKTSNDIQVSRQVQRSSTYAAHESAARRRKNYYKHRSRQDSGLDVVDENCSEESSQKFKKISSSSDYHNEKNLYQKKGVEKFASIQLSSQLSQKNVFSLADYYALGQRGMLKHSRHNLMKRASICSVVSWHSFKSSESLRGNVLVNGKYGDPNVKDFSLEVIGIENVDLIKPSHFKEIKSRLKCDLYGAFSLAEKLRSRKDFSLCLFSPINKFRCFVCRMIDWYYFDTIILILIGLNCITLALERPSISPNSFERSFLTTANFIFTTIFFIEFIIKVIAKGFIWSNEAYLKDGWNILDGLLVLISLVDFLLWLCADQGKKILIILRALRLLRTLRPLRVISKAPGLKLVVQTLLYSLRPIGNIVLICCLFFIVFGILGVQLFKGSLYYCEGPDVSQITNRTQCEQMALTNHLYHWVNRRYNFDNLGQALMTLFVLASKDGWVGIMYTGLDAVGVDMQPIVNHNEWCLLYFISFLLLVGFFVLNMFVGVVVENFQKCRTSQEADLKTKKEKLLKRIGDLRRQASDRGYWAHYSRPRRLALSIVNSKYFDLCISIIMLFNVISMATEFHKMPRELQFSMKVFNLFFTMIFILECFIKIYAKGFVRYFKDRWNKLDLLIICLSCMGIVMEEVRSKSIPINPTIIRVLRVLRITRVLKLLKMAKSVQMLLDTIMQALPEVANLSLLFFLLYFIFAALGVELFGRLECSTLKPCEGLGRHANFEHFGIAFLTLFRVATGDNWSGIMKDTLRDNCDDSENCVRNCCVSSFVTPIYFVVFVLMAQFVLVNVVVAVLMKHLEESNKFLNEEVNENIRNND